MTRDAEPLCSEPRYAAAEDRRAIVFAGSTGTDLTDSISAAMVELYGRVYGHDRTTARTYINDNVVVCILEDILTIAETNRVADGDRAEVIEGRVAFQVGAEDEFTAAIEELTGRRVTAFLSANETDPGVASELFFLEGPPIGTEG